MIRVSPDEQHPTHDFSLTDGEQEVGLIICDSNGDHKPLSVSGASTIRTAVKTTTGNTKYSDFNPPYSPIAQEDWSSGRGGEDYDDDVARFMDSFRCNTMQETIMLGPQETYTKGYRTQDFHLPGNLTWHKMIDGPTAVLAIKFGATATYTPKYVYIYLRKRGNPEDFRVDLKADNAGVPGVSKLSGTATVTSTDIDTTVGQFYRVTIAATSDLTAGTSYWIEVYPNAMHSTSVIRTDEDYWEVGVELASGTTLQSADGTTWEASAVDLYYRVTDVDVAPARMRFFTYKRAAWYVRSTDAGAALYLNGDLGAADANTGALTKVNDSTKSWTVNEWAGAVVMLIGGPGSNESKPWRTIVSNTNNQLTVDSAWIVTHTTSTEYVIVNTDKWQVIAGHGLTAPVTDVFINNGFVYFCQGDAVNIRRFRWYNNAGTATYQYADDGTNKAVYMTSVRDATDGLTIWKANNLDGASQISVAKSAPATTWANMTFDTAIPFLDDNGLITSLQEYGSTKLLWVFREGSVFNINNSKPDEIPLKEMRAMQSYQNGSASLVHGVYLYFNLGSGIERFNDGLLVDMGPNRDAGLPSDRQGIVSAMIGYPGKFFVCVDGGTGTSSLLAYNLIGYHELYRAPAAGQRILHGCIQTIPGGSPDRLWLNVGQDVIWLSMPSMTVDPSKDPNAKFTHEGAVTTGWMYATLFDALKLYNSAKLFTENLDEDHHIIEADYQLDDETTDWIPLGDSFHTSPSQEISLSEKGLTGYRLRMRWRLMTDDASTTPIIKTSVVEAIAKVPVKYSYSFSYRAKDNDVNLLGDQDDYNAADKIALIQGWADGVVQLTMHSTMAKFDNKKVYIDPPPIQPFQEHSEGYIHRMVATEL